MEILSEIVTIGEAARMWGKNQATVRRAIDGGKIPLKARKSDSIWLITTASCRQRWGNPVHPLNQSYNVITNK